MIIWLFVVAILTRDDGSGAWSYQFTIKQQYGEQTAEGDCKADLYRWGHGDVDRSMDAAWCFPVQVPKPFR